MSNGGVEAPKPALREMEQLAAESAREKVRAARWDLSVAVLSYAILGTVIILRIEGVAIEIVATIAVLGLAMIWLAGWKRGKKVFKRFFNEELRQLQELSSGKKAEVPIPSPLTLREIEILDYIARGYINKQVASKLGISEQTVKNHLSSILRKLDVNDRTQAVVLAMHNGWISSRGREPSESTTTDKDNLRLGARDSD